MYYDKIRQLLMCEVKKGYLLKGTVQRKLRGVQNGINRKGLLLTCGAGHLFQFFFSLHPLISIKQLSATTAERIGVVY